MTGLVWLPQQGLQGNVGHSANFYNLQTYLDGCPTVALNSTYYVDAAVQQSLFSDSRTLPGMQTTAQLGPHAPSHKQVSIWTICDCILTNLIVRASTCRSRRQRSYGLKSPEAPQCELPLQTK
jgi:hypothetical protein